jgi:hypothetical protein
MRVNWLIILLIGCGLLAAFISAGPLSVKAQEGFCSFPFEPVSLPLTELESQEYIRMDGQATGFSGGLYPDGSNTRPPAHEAAGLALTAQIEPLDADGNPDPTNGRIVLMSLGMSNTNSEFGAFMNLAHNDSDINPNLYLLNGALGGQTSDRWLDPNALAWQELDRVFERFEISSEQVQLVWIKLTQVQGGDFPAKALALQDDLEVIVQHLQDKFPNLKIVFLSSRTRSYTYWRGLSPEPVAFETGFAVKWLIEKQIQGDPALNFDPTRGDVKAPYLTWGPYLWIDGLNPRADGLTWTAEDMTEDCTHPSLGGQAKVGQMLLDFFRSDILARSWFLQTEVVNYTPSPPLQPTFTPQDQNSPTLPVVTETLDQIPSPQPQDIDATLEFTFTPIVEVTNQPGIPDTEGLLLPLSGLILLIIGLGGYVWRKNSGKPN